MSMKQEMARAIVSEHLVELERVFKKGVALTFLARLPGEPDADFVVTSDDLKEVVDAMERSRDREKDQCGGAQ